MAFSPDGKTIVSGSDDQIIKVWDAGAFVFVFDFFEIWLSESDFSCLAAATLRLQTEKSNAHNDDIRSVAFSPDGKTIVSGSDDKIIKVWDAGAFFHFSIFNLTCCI